MGLRSMLGRRAGIYRGGGQAPWGEIARNMGAKALYRAGLMRLCFRLAGRLSRHRRVAVLVYHKVVPRNLAERCGGVSVEHFSSQMAVLGSLLRPIPPADLGRELAPECRAERSSLPMLLTFDAGYVSNYRYALPVLKKSNLQSLIFVTPSVIGNDQFLWPDEITELVVNSPGSKLTMWENGDGDEQGFELGEELPSRQQVASALKGRLKRLPPARFDELLSDIRKAASAGPLQHHEGTRMVGWRELKRLQNEGMSIGSHTIRHAILANLGREEQAADLMRSRDMINERMGVSTQYVAYPNGQPGDFDGVTMEEAHKAGYHWGFTMVPRLACGGDDNMALPRLCPDDSPGERVALDLLILYLRDLVSNRG